MERHPTNIEGLCEALNGMGIRTTVISRAEAKPNKKQTQRSVEEARRRASKEIARISANSKRLTSR